jgi:hypothetical protein
MKRNRAGHNPPRETDHRMVATADTRRFKYGN